MNEISRPAINKRSLNVLVMIFSFVLLPISGVMLASSHGRPETYGIRHLGQVLHSLAAFVFMATAGIHALANRKAVARLFVVRKAGQSRLATEALIVLALIAGAAGLMDLHTLSGR